MSLDKNKTPETHRATAIASAYLDLRGYKPIETEVMVYDGWIADLASYVYPTATELNKLGLIGKKTSKYSQYIDQKAVDTFRSYRGDGPFTAIVEVKVSRSDFTRDIDTKFSGKIFPAHFCYLAYPKGLIEKIPKGWIGLELSEDCKRLLKVKDSFLCNMHSQFPGQVTDVIAHVGIRRHHRTRFKELRAFVSSFNAKQTATKRIHTIHSALQVIEDFIFGNDDGKELDEMLSWHLHEQSKTAIKWTKKLAEKLKQRMVSK